MYPEKFQKQKGRKLYLEVCSYYRNLIESGALKSGTKLPSIRQLCKNTKISRTTAENAYITLCTEGLVDAKPQSGYFVTGRKLPQKNADKKEFSFEKSDPRAVFDMKAFKKATLEAFDNPERLFSYGDPQGEIELRQQVAEYLLKSRGVPALADEIVIGAGTQTLISLICALAPHIKTVYFNEGVFEKGHFAFKNSGVKLSEEIKNSFFYITKTPTAEQRSKILSDNNIAYIIEDDVNTGLSTMTRQIPAIKGFDRAGRVIYLGSFSKLVAPSLRISFAVLPPNLLQTYKKNFKEYHQTASTLEQLALAKFIAGGYLDKQVRKLRKTRPQGAQNA